MSGEVGGGLGGLLFHRLDDRLGNVARQQNAERRADARLAFAEDVAAGLLDDAVDHGEAEAGALADFLGGEEGLEDLAAHFLGNAVAVVLDLDQDVVGRRQRFLVERRAIGRGDVARAQRDPTALAHRVARVDDEIDDDLLELIEVGLHQPQIASVHDVELDRFADQPAQQHLQFRQHLAELQRLRTQGLPAREREQLAHQPRRAVGVLLDLHDVLEGRIGRPMVGEQQIGIADDRGQHVVEIVGDAAGELADRLHLLALREVLLQRALLGGVEREHDGAGAFVAMRVRGGDEEARRAGALALQRDVDGRDVALAFARCGDRLTQRRAIALGDAAIDRGTAFAGARLQRKRSEPCEGAVGAQDDALQVDRGDRHRRRIEESREANFGGAQILALVFARRAVEHQRARGAGQPGAGKGDAMQQTHRQELALPALEIDVEAFGRHFSGSAGDDAQQRRAVGGDDIGKLELSSRELRDIIIEPIGEGGVHMRDRAVGFGGEKARRRVIEIVDGVLQILKEALVSLAFARDVGDRPQRHPRLGDALERAHADAVPGRRAVAGQGRGHAQFFDRPIARVRGLREPVDRLGHLRRAGEQPFDKLEVRRARGARQDAIGLVGVNDARIGVGDDQPVVVGIGDGLGRVETAGAARELQLPERVEQDREHAEHRQGGDGPGHGFDAELSGQ